MDISALAGGMDLATMKMLISGGTATQQLSQSAAKAEQVPVDAVSIAMQAKVLDAARGELDVYA